MNTTTIKTPIGFLRISERGGMLTEISHTAKYSCAEGEYTETLADAVKQLEEYFDGQRKVFDLPLKIEGSKFKVRVLNALAQVPYGETVTYGQLAEKCGSKGAARAVGTAMRKNPFVIVLPCHRVLPQGGKLGNYSAGGPANKEWLLTFEKQNGINLLFNILNMAK